MLLLRQNFSQMFYMNAMFYKTIMVNKIYILIYKSKLNLEERYSLCIRCFPAED